MAYRYLLDRKVQEVGPDGIDTSLPHLEAVTVKDGRRTVRIVGERFDEGRIAAFVFVWLRGMIAGQPMRVAENVLTEYGLSVVHEQLPRAEDVDALLGTGMGVRVMVAALDKENFRERSRVWFEKEVSRLVTIVGHALRLRRASLEDLERLMGLRPLKYAAEPFAYCGEDYNSCARLRSTGVTRTGHRLQRCSCGALPCNLCCFDRLGCGIQPRSALVRIRIVNPQRGKHPFDILFRGFQRGLALGLLA
jgi:hypothetical protein